MAAHETVLGPLLRCALGEHAAREVLRTVAVTPGLPSAAEGWAPRAHLAQALALVLFHQLLDRVPAGRAHVHEVRAQGGRVVFDHGAVRTVAWPCGGLPAGQAAIGRLLGPLGYSVAGVYPLPRLGMTGRAWCHLDHPEDLPQYFVSEFHPERFSPQFQATVTRVVGRSADPLGPREDAALEQLARGGGLPLDEAQALLPRLVACFDRQHELPSWADYQALLAESPEMAWISTEGNAFNHATDRVDDVAAVAQAQRALGRPVKDSIEVSRSGRVRQTAFRAHPVRRLFPHDDGLVEHAVPGSFYEFIQRAPLPGQAGGQGDHGGKARLDLAFDAGNAAGIFGMTAGTALAGAPGP